MWLAQGRDIGSPREKPSALSSLTVSEFFSLFFPFSSPSHSTTCENGPFHCEANRSSSGWKKQKKTVRAGESGRRRREKKTETLLWLARVRPLCSVRHSLNLQTQLIIIEGEQRFGKGRRAWPHCFEPGREPVPSRGPFSSPTRLTERGSRDLPSPLPFFTVKRALVIMKSN